MDFSVIIPTFRRPGELAEAVASVLAQPGVSLQVIVVDDCAAGSAEAAVPQDSRVRYLRNPAPSQGRPGAVRNLAWPLAEGALVHFLDDDDRVPEGHYAAAKAEFAARPGVGVVFGRIAPFGVDAEQVAVEHGFFDAAARSARRLQRFGPRWGFGARLLCGQTLLVGGSALIRRGHVAALGGFDEDLPLMEDIDLYTRAVARFGAHYTDRVTLHYRIAPSLMYRPDVAGPVNESYRLMQAKFRREHGAARLRARQVFTRFAA